MKKFKAQKLKLFGTRKWFSHLKQKLIENDLDNRYLLLQDYHWTQFGRKMWSRVQMWEIILHFSNRMTTLSEKYLDIKQSRKVQDWHHCIENDHDQPIREQDLTKVPKMPRGQISREPEYKLSTWSKFDHDDVIFTSLWRHLYDSFWSVPGI